MKVSELIKHLKTLDQNLEVWYTTDQEYFFKATMNEAGNNEFEVCLLGEAP